LGGRALVVEGVLGGSGGGQVQVFMLFGHPRESWRLEGAHRFTLSSAEMRQLAAAVDRAIADRVTPPGDPEEQILCMDGPGYLTERVSNGAVLNLVGQCPQNQRDPHPNEVIATLIRDMLCRRHDPAADRRYWQGRRCFTPPFTMQRR
jgi:hypothetical protein